MYKKKLNNCKSKSNIFRNKLNIILKINSAKKNNLVTLYNILNINK